MKTQYLAALAGMLCMAGCTRDFLTPPYTRPVTGNPPKEITAGESRIISSDNDFGFTMLRQLNSDAQNDNVVISPMSVSMALGMTLNGARGTTESDMRSTLGFSGLTSPEINEAYRSMIDRLTTLDPSVKFQVANSIWNRTGFTVRPEFQEINRKYFDAQTSEVDFSDPSAGPTINSWVKTKTNGRIESIVPMTIPNDVVMYLINAIYFKGAWKETFDTKQTRDGMFTRRDGGTVPVKMMYRTSPMRYQQNERFSAVDLPYGNGSFSMTILLPAVGSNADDLLNGLGSQQWNSMYGGFTKQKIALGLPKFKIEYGSNLNDALKTMGMSIAFSSAADLSGIAGVPGDLYISNVRHKTFIEVNEEGTEAAAATSVEIGRTSVEPLPTMILNRPFIFAIRESQSGRIIFLGKIADPTK